VFPICCSLSFEATGAYIHLKSYFVVDLAVSVYCHLARTPICFTYAKFSKLWGMRQSLSKLTMVFYFTVP